MKSAGDNPQAAISTITGSIENRRNQRIRKYFRGYCESTSIHGLRYLAEKRSFCERLLWAVLIITSVSVCAYLISRIYERYDRNPVIVSFATKESPISTIPYPAVTICPVSKTNRKKFNYTKIIRKKIRNETVTPEEELKAQYLAFLCVTGMEYFPKTKTLSDDFFHTLDEVQIPTFTHFCMFMGELRSCNTLFKSIILDEGICYTFNLLDREEIFRDNVYGLQKKVHYANYHKHENVSDWNIDDGYIDSKINTFPRRALLSGANNALEIIFFEWVSNIDYACVKNTQGYMVTLSVPHSIPLLRKRYFQVPLDRSVICAIQPKMMKTSPEVKRYLPKDRKCYFSTERPLKFFRLYTPDNCRLECLTNYTLKRCECVDFYMPRDNMTSICGNGNLQCMRHAEMQLKVIEVNNLINFTGDEDYCNCIPLCTELSYDMELSQSEWDWHKQLQIHEKSDRAQPAKHLKFAKLSVYFKQEHFLTSQRNELYGPTDFLANFGGLLGLFTGFSLLSLMEILYFLTIRIFCNIRKYKVWTGVAE